MDDGLVHVSRLTVRVLMGRLNPCCSGRWSSTWQHVRYLRAISSLNPCCSGRWSSTESNNIVDALEEFVLILVVVDDGLVPLTPRIGEDAQARCLNPCCSGRWSSTKEGNR